MPDGYPARHRTRSHATGDFAVIVALTDATLGQNLAAMEKVADEVIVPLAG